MRKSALRAFGADVLSEAMAGFCTALTVLRDGSHADIAQRTARAVERTRRLLRQTQGFTSTMPVSWAVPFENCTVYSMRSVPVKPGSGVNHSAMPGRVRPLQSGAPKRDGPATTEPGRSDVVP